MITINGKRFAEEGDSIERTTGTAKRYKRKVELFNHGKRHIGTINGNGVLCKATPQPNGTWYSYGDIEELGPRVGFVKLETEIQKIATKISINKDYSYRYYYK